MPVTVKIPTQLRAATDGDATASVQGSTVGEVLDALYDRYGELRSRIAEDGGLRRFVNVYVGGEDIRFLDGLDTPVSDGDEVTILPAVAGGCPAAPVLIARAICHSATSPAPVAIHSRHTRVNRRSPPGGRRMAE